ncbi:MAG: hypothetical protein QJR08_00355 [Bacillota bacterium]|nr:hypothetical protein [Bacillota bacterium]
MRTSEDKRRAVIEWALAHPRDGSRKIAAATGVSKSVVAVILKEEGLTAPEARLARAAELAGGRVPEPTAAGGGAPERAAAPAEPAGEGTPERGAPGREPAGQESAGQEPRKGGPAGATGPEPAGVESAGAGPAITAAPGAETAGAAASGAETAGETAAGDLFRELDLLTRWRLRSDVMEPRREKAPVRPPEDPLAGRPAEAEEEAGGEAEEEEEEEAGGEEPSEASTRQAIPRIGVPDVARLGKAAAEAGARAAEIARAALARPPVRLAGGRGREGEAPREPEPASPAIRLRTAADAEALRWPVVSFIGALPQAGTTTALVAWLLAQADAGVGVAAIDAAERPALAAFLTGSLAWEGWESPRARRELTREPWRPAGLERVAFYPRGWRPEDAAPDPDATAAALPELVRAALSSGAVSCAVDLGSFQPLRGGWIDPRVAWAARAGLVALVAPANLFGVEAASRWIHALRSAGARRVSVLLTRIHAGSPGAGEVASALEAAGAPADRVIALDWDPAELDRSLGRGPAPVRLREVLPLEAARAAAAGR